MKISTLRRSKSRTLRVTNERDFAATSSAAWYFEIRTARRIFNEPLAEGFARRRSVFQPDAFGHYDEGLSGADTLRSFRFGKAQDFGQFRLRLGDGPHATRF